MRIVKFLTQLRTLNVELWLDGDKLRCKAPSSAMTPEIRQKLATNKEDIIAFLKKTQKLVKPKASPTPVASKQEAAPSVPAQKPVEEVSEPEFRRQQLSPSQKRIWILEQLRQSNSVCHTTYTWKLMGPLSLKHLKQALELVQSRHEALRMGFAEEDGRPGLRVHSEGTTDFTVFELPQLKEGNVHELLQRWSYHPFDLKKPPLFRLNICRLAINKHLVQLTAHRLIADDQSLATFADELSLAYTGALKGEKVLEDSPEEQYSDFITNQNLFLNDNRSVPELQWWKEQLHHSLTALDLPTDSPRPKTLNFDASRHQFQIGGETLNNLRIFKGKSGIDKDTILLATFKLLLFRLCHQKDILIGFNMEPEQDHPKRIGNYDAWKVLRTQIAKSKNYYPTYSEFLSEIHENLRAINQRPHIPYEVILDTIRPERDLSRNSLFQVAFTQNISPPPNLGIEGIETLEEKVTPITTELDLWLDLEINQDNILGYFTYNSQLFNEETISNFAKQYWTLINNALTAPDQQITDIPLIPTEHTRQLVQTWNETAHNFQTYHSLHSLFENQVKQTPHATAVALGSHKLTYEELNAKANQLAHYLIEHGLQLNGPVLVYMNRSIERTIGLMAVLKAGGVYVPLTPDHPIDRIQRMSANVQASMLLTQRDLSKEVSTLEPKSIYLDPEWDHFEDYAPTNPNRKHDPSLLAYIVFSSDPNGKYNGVTTDHRSVCNRLLWLQDTYKMEPSDTFLQKTPFGYDISVWEIFWPITVGACLILAERGAHRDPMAIARIIKSTKITHLHFVPSMLNEFLAQKTSQECTSIRQVFCSGEAIPVDLQRHFFKAFPKANLHNLYGPPEVTMDATYWDYQQTSSLTFPIGRPIANVQTYLVDPYFNLVPVGVVGELLIGGKGLSQGYLKQPQSTTLRFIPDPFSIEPGSRLFKTGDLAKYLPDGSLEFVGHIQNHRRVRGFRIDFGEIKAHLENHRHIAEATVIFNDDNDGEIIAYIQPYQRIQVDEEDLRNFLKRILPNYMIPKHFVTLKQTPRTPNGKIDHHSLPLVCSNSKNKEEAFARAHSEIERVIIQAWRSVLGDHKFNVDSDFFQIGGDSLGIVKVYKALPKLLQQDLTIMDLFKHPTVRDLANYFEAKEEELALSNSGSDHRDQVRQIMEEIGRSAGLNIAIIGMSGRFPGAKTIDDLWNLVSSGQHAMTTFSRDELLDSGVEVELLDDPNYVPIGGVIEDIRLFDAEFFGFTPREAQITDPQQRIFLECAWEALEKSGYVPQKFNGKIGVYGGSGFNEYFSNHIGPNQQIWDRVGPLPIMIGNLNDNLCTRVAFKLGLSGPALSVQSACSTGLVSVHLACQGLLSNDCDLAIAGGVSLGNLHKEGYVYEEGMTLPPDGICRSFDERAQGNVQTPGAAVVALKRLSDAIRDGDRIYSVIKGTAINNDGDSKDNYTGYSRKGQTDVIKRAMKVAQTTADDIQYVETSSTGSQLGDPIEVGSLKDAYGSDEKQSISLGALKPNIGGLDTAAGTAALIKASLALYKRKLLPLANFEKPNPKLELETTPFYINTRLRDWESNKPRRCGVNAFGMGGTNAHIVLEEGPRFDPSPQSRTWQVITLSAKTQAALDQLTKDFVNYMEAHPHHNFADMCYTQHVGRQDYKYRRVLVSNHLHDAVLELRKDASDRIYTARHKGEHRKLAFMFPGQGAQYLNMGRQLYREERTFRQEFDACWNIVTEHFGDIFGNDNPNEIARKGGKLDRTIFTQPMLFATEYALARLLIHWGIKPGCMIGNSLGEFVAACLADVMSLEDAIIAIVQRGILMQARPPGAQLAVNLGEEKARELLNDQLSLAGTRNPKSCVISGAKEAITQLKHQLDAKGIHCHRLHTSHAFHSYMMHEVADDFMETMKGLQLNPPKIPFISNVTGTWISDDEATNPEYWASQLREPVLFSQGLEGLFKDPDILLLEVGPEKFLSQAAIKHPAKTRDHRVLATMRTPNEDESDLHHLLNTIGRLWLAGIDIDWEAYHGEKKRFRMPIPTYPFERVKHWIDRKKMDYMPVIEPDVFTESAEPEEDHYRPNVPTEFVPPRNDDETFVAALWSEFLGLEEVGIHDDFFELGGTSLIAVRLIAELGKRFNVPLASHIILKKRTVSSLTEFINENKTNTTQEDSPLVEIQRGHPRGLPLFMVHPIGGEVFFYREMAAALGSEVPFYAFQAPSLVGKHAPFTDIREQAAFYIKELLKFQPRSPYVLGGSSYGGLVAFEMASQLKERGYKVALVALVDSPAPGQMPGKTSDFAEILDYLLGDELNINVNELRELEPDEQLAFVFEEARYANRMDLLSPTLGIPMFNTWLAHQEAMHSYQPKPYDGRIIYFRPSEAMKLNPVNMHLPWIDIVQGGMELHKIPGNHLSMNSQPNVQILARHLKRALATLG